MVYTSHSADDLQQWYSYQKLRFSKASSVMDSPSGQVRFNSSAFLQIFDTVFLETLQLSAMFLSLKFRLFNLIISRYLVMIIDLLILYLHQMVHDYSIKEFMIRFPISRNHDSKHPEWWFPTTGILALSTGSVALKVRTDGSKGAGILNLYQND